MNWTDQLFKALALLLVIAVVARLVADLLGPVLPSLLMLGGLVVVIVMTVRGPRAKR
ncbi:MAG: hypothetical protein M0Z95_20210 [Actinomycetota bacterium]|nr:hypothetical protein [Actinomycetota bacterium]